MFRLSVSQINMIYVYDIWSSTDCLKVCMVIMGDTDGGEVLRGRDG